MKDAYRVAKARGIVTALGESVAPDPAKNKPRSRKPDSRTKPRGATASFVGNWRIIEMDGPSHIEIDKRGVGRFHFGRVSGEMDCRFSTEDGQPLMEFSWDGNDEHHAVMGRGRATVDDKATMHGRIYTHHADDTAFAELE